MKLKRILLPILAWSGLLLTSCHCEHGEVDGLLSSLQVGNVVCSDGNILSMDRFRVSIQQTPYFPLWKFFLVLREFKT